jgi:tetratricopeptide (TPR) repeat protein
MLSSTGVGPADSGSLAAYEKDLQTVDWSDSSPSAAPGVWFSALYGLHRHLAVYLTGLASARRGDTEVALAAAQSLESMATPDGYGSLIADWTRGVRAAAAFYQGRIEAAMEGISSYEGRVWYQYATSSAFLTLAYERYLRARILEESGLLEDALRWYASFEAVGVHELIFLAPSHLRRATIHAQLGNVETARRHYARALELWDEADPHFRQILNEVGRKLSYQ